MKLEEKQFYTVKEVAQNFNLSLPTIYYWIREGKIEAEKIDGKLQVPKEELDTEKMRIEQEARKGIVEIITNYGKNLKRLINL